MRHFDLDSARRAIALWEGDPATLDLIAHSGNSVYSFRVGTERRILRLTNAAHRTPAMNAAEMSFLAHLERQNVNACAPVPSASGALIETIDGGSACVLTWAAGEFVEPGSAHWNAEFFREWGRTLARIHFAARDYDGPPRWDWREEHWIADAYNLFPADDALASEEFALAMSRIERLPRTRENFGMIHHDYAPQNFNFDPTRGITAFDFGNCCHHWFVQDIAISLSVLRRHAERGTYRAWLLEGYREVLPIDPATWSHLFWFLRLRILYVYLSRLDLFGAAPTPDQRETLDLLRSRVAERFEWP